MCRQQNEFDRIEVHRNLDSGFCMGIRPLFIILILLLNAVVARGDKPTVIKDSEAIHYVGKEVDVHG